jgi:hypothetical protein
VIRSEQRLAQCRTLDAIHLGTALFLNTNNDQGGLTLCSFDQEMLKLAECLGLNREVV